MKVESATKGVPSQKPASSMISAAKTNEIDPMLHPDQVAKLLGLSTSWLAKARMNGTGPRFTKFGRAVRYSLAAVREFIKSRQRNSTSEE